MEATATPWGVMWSVGRDRDAGIGGRASAWGQSVHEALRVCNSAETDGVC